MDDETRQRFDALDKRLSGLDESAASLFERMDQRFEGVDRQLQAIVARLDEQDQMQDTILRKMDRLNVLARAGEEATSSLAAPSRRVAKLEALRRGDDDGDAA